MASLEKKKEVSFPNNFFFPFRKNKIKNLSLQSFRIVDNSVFSSLEDMPHSSVKSSYIELILFMYLSLKDLPPNEPTCKQAPAPSIPRREQWTGTVAVDGLLSQLLFSRSSHKAIIRLNVFIYLIVKRVTD